MRWLALEAGDAATWGSTVVTFAMACYAIGQGISQRRDLRRQNELQAEASQLQRRQIETAERRTLVMEQLLAQLTATSGPSAPDPRAGGASQPWAQPAAYGSGPAAAAGAPAGGGQPSGPVFSGPVSGATFAPAGEGAFARSGAGTPAQGQSAPPPTQPPPPVSPAGDPFEEPFEDADEGADEEFGEDHREEPREKVPSAASPDEDSAGAPPAPAPADAAEPADGYPGAAQPPGPPGGYGCPPPPAADGYPQPAGDGTPPPPRRRPGPSQPQAPAPVPGPAAASPAPAGYETPASGYGTPAPGFGTPAAPPPSPWPYQPQAPAPAQPQSPYAPAGPWRIERAGRHVFALRNTGTTTLTGVRVDRGNLPDSARGVPEDAIVRPGETAEFLMAADRGQALPGTVLVSWHGRPGGVHVPVPQG
ncbi:hypothetical protein [Streptomyces marispadix]|uniref:Uncharacterized protein n=1 Tax=Streptomyces marispadix TaxID=2922868 RepID=A0ABS9T6G7_9ACTN|nr:hypothetical protein [Streptomyces marispadix]MCH6163911.1 hypothetical protein [Streptomyces marispadix]